ncbi:MAG: rhomboid family protein [Candidatus Scalindua rubra]|uniref:Rhomboid family protein n=1 Tax=Candidatus Scalindua rubra TaxID=1872076 RepID=A0A1E3XBE8_9BACT|nr:MAG: rhomboid family protein [Candidatus Scalindua rubra]
MIPIRDKNPSSTFPYVTIGIIVVNVIVFLIELSLGTRLDGFIMEYGVVPLKVTYYSQVPDLTFMNTFFPFISSMFLHGGFIHLIGNMWFLWIFGDNIEDKLGHFKYLGFYILCGIIASSVHVFFNSQSGVPCVGASGAIAGVLGAYMITFPHARVVTIVPLFIFLQVIELPAMIVLGFWFVIQFFNGAASISASATSGGVAWWAHIGGFVSGVIIFFIMRIFYVRKPGRYR